MFMNTILDSLLISLPGRIVTGGPHTLDECGDPPLTLIAAKTTVFAYSTTFDNGAKDQSSQ
jgi:hypothetical protein